MIKEDEKKRVSKFLSLVLRHQPEAVGLSLDENGWADMNELITKMNLHGFSVTFDLLVEVVSTNNKQRFSFDETRKKIRANQGHSLHVNLELEEIEPPGVLYHGTAEKNIESIKKLGLEKKNRQHVHLSSDVQTAEAVGKRHGRPVVLLVDCTGMVRDGYKFYLSENKVWLTDHVPACYLQPLHKLA